MTVRAVQPHALPNARREPPLPKGDRDSVVFKDAGGDVFEHGPSANEVEQGTLGDCAFIAALSSFARTHPEKLQQSIREVGTTTNKRGETVKQYEVRLYAKHAATVGRFPALGPKTRDGYTPVAITIDGELPVYRKQLQKKGKVVDAYGTTRHRSDDEKWVGLFEKAYAQLLGGYDNVNQGSETDKVISSLTGNRAERTQLPFADPDETFASLKEALRRDRVVVAETYFNNGARAPASEKIGHALRLMYGDKAPNGKGPYNGHAPLDGRKPRYDPTTFKYDDDDADGKNGLIAEHCYSVVGVKTDPDGTRYVELRNPWGNVEPTRWNPPGRNDGRFRMPLEDFMTLFCAVAVG